MVVAGVGTELALAKPVRARTLTMNVVCMRVMFPSDTVLKFTPRKVWVSDSSVIWNVRLRAESMRLSEDWVLAMKSMSSTYIRNKKRKSAKIPILLAKSTKTPLLNRHLFS